MKTKRMWVLMLLLGSFRMVVPDASAYYNPETGRWLSRDPVEERGGENLYGFVRNAPGQFVDTDGRQLSPPLCNTCKQVALPGHKCIPVPPPAPLAGDELGFEMCRRDALGNDCRTRIANAHCGGAHSFVRNKFINDEGEIDYRGWGWSGHVRPNLEPDTLVKPKHECMVSCAKCERTDKPLADHVGVKKTGKDASDQEIWDCLQSIPTRKPYNGLGYNCWSYAKEAAEKCGLSCPTPPSLKKPAGI